MPGLPALGQGEQACQRLIFDIAPLGSLIVYSDAQPKPPARFTTKLAA